MRDTILSNKTTHQLDCIIKHKRHYPKITVDQAVKEMQKRQKKKNIKNFVNNFGR